MRSRPWAWAALPLAALLVYCEARRDPERRAAQAPPFRVSAAASASHAPVASALFSLSDFRPLLTLPELSNVAGALDSAGPVAAARELEASLAKLSPPAEERFRYDFLLARLHEQAAEFGPANAAYGRVAEGSSPLVDYARVGKARALLALGRVSEVELCLAKVPDSEPVARLKWPVLADAARLSGNALGAVVAYQRVVGDLRPGAARAEAELRLASALLESVPPDPSQRTEQLLAALSLCRRIEDEPNVSPASVTASAGLEARILAQLPEPERSGRRTRDAREQLDRIRALSDARRFAEAERAAEETLAAVPTTPNWDPSSCEVEFLLGKALSARRAHGRAGEVFESLLNHCADPDLRARARFMSGKAAASGGEHMLAVQRFEALEQEYPRNTLADDARVYGALSYLELGVEARFTELLIALPDDYPEGDMVAEGSFRLALRRFDKQDFQGAVRVLERVLGNKYVTGARAADFAGRERYFHARALAATGETERALEAYEALIGDLPLSYYMLCAYSALTAADSGRAQAAIARASAAASSAPVLVLNRPEFSGLGFGRALELFGVGDLENGAQELDALGLADSSRPEILWGLSKLYAEAGSVKLSHAAARRAMFAAPPSWPAAAWLDAWKLAYPAPYGPLVQREAKRTGQSPALIYAIMREESAFDPEAESPADAYGLMQLILPTAKSMARPLGLPSDRAALKRPSVNITLGTSVLAKYAESFPDNALLAIPAYNAGPGNPKRWLRERPNADFDLWVELIPFVETRRYMKRVLASRAAYALLYQPEEFPSFALLPSKVQ